MSSTVNKMSNEIINIILTGREDVARSLTIGFLGMNDVWKFGSILSHYYITKASFREAKCV